VSEAQATVPVGPPGENFSVFRDYQRRLTPSGRESNFVAFEARYPLWSGLLLTLLETQLPGSIGSPGIELASLGEGKGVLLPTADAQYFVGLERGILQFFGSVSVLLMPKSKLTVLVVSPDVNAILGYDDVMTSKGRGRGKQVHPPKKEHVFQTDEGV
jgi:hypothetical protein